MMLLTDSDALSALEENIQARYISLHMDDFLAVLRLRQKGNVAVTSGKHLKTHTMY